MGVYRFKDRVLDPKKYPWGYSGIWTPARIETSLWLDAADEGTITLDGSGNVEQWKDKSGNGYHVSQSNSSLRPYYNSTEKAVEWPAGESTVHLSGVMPAADVNNTVSLCVVVEGERTTSSGYKGIIQLATARRYLDIWNYVQSNRQNVTFYYNDVWFGDGTYNTYLNTDASPQLLAIYYSEGQAIARWDGGLFASAVVSSLSLSGNQEILIGWNTFSGTHGWEGVFREVVASPNQDIEKIEGYLAHKWGFAGKLPIDHPYKDVAP